MQSCVAIWSSIDSMKSSLKSFESGSMPENMVDQWRRNSVSLSWGVLSLLP